MGYFNNYVMLHHNISLSVHVGVCHFLKIGKNSSNLCLLANFVYYHVKCLLIMGTYDCFLFLIVLLLLISNREKLL